MLTVSSQGVLSIKCGQAQYLEQSQVANTTHPEKKYMKWKLYQHWKKQNNSREEGASKHRIEEHELESLVS